MYDPGVNNVAGENFASGMRQGNNELFNLMMGLFHGGGASAAKPAETMDPLTGYNFGSTTSPAAGSKLSY